MSTTETKKDLTSSNKQDIVGMEDGQADVAVAANEINGGAGNKSCEYVEQGVGVFGNNHKIEFHIHDHQDKRSKPKENEEAAKAGVPSEEDRKDVTVTISGQWSKPMPQSEISPVHLKDGHIDIAGHYDDNNITTKVACQKGFIVQLKSNIETTSEQKGIYHTVWTLVGKSIDNIATRLPVLHGAIFELKERIQRVYGAILRLVGQGSLVLEFEHFTRENAEKMVDEKDNVVQEIKAVLGKFSMHFEDVSCTVVIKDLCDEDVEKEAPLPSHDIKRGEQYAAASGGDRTDEIKLGELQNDSEVTGCLICSSLVKERDEDTDVNILVCHLHASYVVPQMKMPSGKEAEPIKPQRKKKVQEISHKVSALRNSGGGTLYLHVRGMKTTSSCVRYVDELICTRLSCMLEPEESFDDVYKRTIQDDKSVIKLTVSYSSKLILSDTCTSSPTFDHIEMTSPQQLRSHLVRSRAVANSDPQLRGLSDVLLEGIEVKFKSVVNQKVTEHGMVKCCQELRLIQYITAFSKNVNGGSLYFGITDNISEGYKLEGVPLAMIGDQTILEKCLQELIADNVVIVENISQRKPYDLKNLVAVGFHKVNDERCVIEVAVRPVYGCVFTNKNGPIACKLNEKCELVRMSVGEVMQRLKDKA